MKKIMALLLSMAMCFALLTACGSNGASNSSSNTSTPASGSATSSDSSAEAAGSAAGSTDSTGSGALTGTLKLGAIGPLTGGNALYGNAAANGDSIAVEEINALSSDFQIEFNSQDDEGDPEKSVNAYNQLKDWHAQAIVGCVTTAPCVAVSAEAYNDRIFMLTPSASSTDVTNGKDNMFQICFTDPGQGSTAAQYIADNQLSDSIAIIYNNSDPYSTGIYNAFQAKADELGLNIVSTTTFTDDTATDFSVQLSEAQKAGADFIFLPIYYTPASLILQQAKSMGYAPSFFGCDGMDGILGMEGFDTSLAEGMMLMTPFSASDTDEATAQFVSEYQSQFNETPIQFAADGYDCVYAIYEALTYYAENNGGLDVTDMAYKDMCEILISVFTDANFSHDGLTGAGMTWTTSGEVNKDPKVYVIKDGAYVVAE